MNLPKPYISYNQIRLYQICPKKYYFSYIEEVSTPISDKILLGMVFHAVVEEFFKKRIAGSELDQDELLQVFKETYAAMADQYEVDWQSERQHSEKRGLGFTKYFFRELAPSLDPLMVEQELEVELPDMDIKLRGIIDLVEKDFSLTDFKTTTSKWSKERIKNSYLQMVVYKYLFEKTFASAISQLKICIVYSKNDSHIKCQSIARNAVDFSVEKMFDIVKYVVDNICREVFYKNESYFCGFCEYRDICRTRT